MFAALLPVVGGLWVAAGSVSKGVSRLPLGPLLAIPLTRWVRLAQRSYQLWRKLEAECGRPLLDLHGTLDVDEGDWA